MNLNNSTEKDHARKREPAKVVTEAVLGLTLRVWFFFQVHQVEMEGVVRGIQADMTKLSKSHSHTSNTVSKLLDKSRKLSVTMKEVSRGGNNQTELTCHASGYLQLLLLQVREKMERQGAQVKKLEANHAHLIHRNNFKVLIFQVRSDTKLRGQAEPHTGRLHSSLQNGWLNIGFEDT